MGGTGNGSRGTVNITNAVTGGDGYVSSDLAPGSFVDLRLYLTVPRRASLGRASWTVTATSVTDPTKVDAVRAVVRVTRGR